MTRLTQESQVTYRGTDVGLAVVPGPGTRPIAAPNADSDGADSDDK